MAVPVGGVTGGVAAGSQPTSRANDNSPRYFFMAIFLNQARVRSVESHDDGGSDQWYSARERRMFSAVVFRTVERGGGGSYSRRTGEVFGILRIRCNPYSIKEMWTDWLSRRAASTTRRTVKVDPNGISV